MSEAKFSADVTEPVRRAFDSVKKEKLTQQEIDAILAPHLAKNAVKQLGLIRSAFPDLKVTLDDIITEGDKVVARWTAQGTHRGEGTLPGFGAVKPTGKQTTIRGITIHRIEKGMIVETWGATEKLEAMMELGLVGQARS